MRWWSGAALALFLAASSRAEEHQIEREARQCLEKAGSSSTMAACTRLAADQWRAEVSRLSVELAGMVDPLSRPALKSAQVEWERFQAAEDKSIGRIYAQMKGGASALMMAEDQMELVRTRASELKKYIDLLKESKP